MGSRPALAQPRAGHRCRSADRRRAPASRRGRGGANSYTAWALDLVFAFFVNCYHLRDWLIESGHSSREVVDAHINGSEALVWCRDICNGMKHCRLDPARPTTKYQSWTTATESAVFIAVGESGERPEPVAGFYWTFVDPASGARLDMFDLAGACVAAWASFIRERHTASRSGDPGKSGHES